MAKIVFDPGGGDLTVESAWPAPGNRFASWTPTTRPIGDAATAQGTGARSMFTYRTDYGASFEMRGISSHAVNGVAMVDLADQLIEWLLGGGTCEVETEDAESNTYETCGLMPESSPSLQLADRGMMEYTLSLAVINLAASPTQMVCRYDGSEVVS